jgi:hypothetical protein
MRSAWRASSFLGNGSHETPLGITTIFFADPKKFTVFFLSSSEKTTMCVESKTVNHDAIKIIALLNRDRFS